MAENRVLELNGGDDEDEALRIAIAMSLGQDLTQAEQDAIDLTQDESPPTLSVSTLSPIPDAQPGQEDARPAPPVSGPSSSWAFGMDRKKMEEDRLARLKKRKAQELGETEASEQSQRQKRTYETAPSPPSVLSAAPSIPASRALPIVVREGVAPIPTPNPAAAKSNHRSSLAFPRGVVKKTWAYGQPRLGDDIKIEEVLQKDRLELAVLSSFQWDEDWLMSKIDIRRTKMVLIAFASNEAQVGPPGRTNSSGPSMTADSIKSAWVRVLEQSLTGKIERRDAIECTQGQDPILLPANVRSRRDALQATAPKVQRLFAHCDTDRQPRLL